MTRKKLSIIIKYQTQVMASLVLAPSKCSIIHDMLMKLPFNQEKWPYRYKKYNLFVNF